MQNYTKFPCILLESFLNTAIKIILTLQNFNTVELFLFVGVNVRPGSHFQFFFSGVFAFCGSGKPGFTVAVFNQRNIVNEISLFNLAKHNLICVQLLTLKK